jgi:hypothetical protein
MALALASHSGMSASRLLAKLLRSATSEELDAVPNIAAMRRAIVCATHDNGLIRQCLEVAERHDLEEEEMYVWLAYHALARMEELAGRFAQQAPETPGIRANSVGALTSLAASVRDLD